MTAGRINSEVFNYYDSKKRRIIKKPITQMGMEMLKNEFVFIDYAPVLQEICIDINCFNPFFISMDYRGESLQSKMSKNSLNIPLSKLLTKLASATNQISDFIHGDIKPENILICNDELYFIDYGCSRFVPGKAIAFTKEYADNNLINYGILEYSSDKFAFAQVLKKIYLYYLKNDRIADIDINALVDCINTIFEKTHLLSWNDIRSLITQACRFANYTFIGRTDEMYCKNSTFDYHTTRGKLINLWCLTGSYSDT